MWIPEVIHVVHPEVISPYIGDLLWIDWAAFVDSIGCYRLAEGTVVTYSIPVRSTHLLPLPVRSISSSSSISISSNSNSNCCC